MTAHATIPGSLIHAFGLDTPLTERDKQANKLNRYLVDDGTKLTWRTGVLSLEVPVQPPRIDSMQRELLEGSVNLDPHPQLRNELRTHDITDSSDAGNFVRTQVAKHIEHFTAAKGNPRNAAKMSAHNIEATSAIRLSRIVELRNSSGKPTKRQPRP